MELTKGMIFLFGDTVAEAWCNQWVEVTREDGVGGVHIKRLSDGKEVSSIAKYLVPHITSYEMENV